MTTIPCELIDKDKIFNILLKLHDTCKPEGESGDRVNPQIDEKTLDLLRQSAPDTLKISINNLNTGTEEKPEGEPEGEGKKGKEEGEREGEGEKGKEEREGEGEDESLEKTPATKASDISNKAAEAAMRRMEANKEPDPPEYKPLSALTKPSSDLNVSGLDEIPGGGKKKIIRKTNKRSRKTNKKRTSRRTNRKRTSRRTNRKRKSRKTNRKRTSRKTNRKRTSRKTNRT